MFHLGANKESLTKAAPEPPDRLINMPALNQLSYLALCWQSPYFVDIYVPGCQSEEEAVQPVPPPMLHFKLGCNPWLHGSYRLNGF